MTTTSHTSSHSWSSSEDDWQEGSIVDEFSDPQQQSQRSGTELPDWDEWDSFQAGISKSPVTPTNGAGGGEGFFNLKRNSSSTSASSNSAPARTGNPSINSHSNNAAPWGASSSSSSSSSSVLSPPSQSSYNQADEDFFAALEKSATSRSNSYREFESPSSIATRKSSPPKQQQQQQPQQQRNAISSPVAPPSPPIIDLRPEERRIREREQQQKRGGKQDEPEEDDWFARFEKDPTMGKRIRQESRASSVDQSQLDSIHEAQSSPMVSISDSAAQGSARGGDPQGDYFAGVMPSSGNEAQQTKWTLAPPPLQAQQTNSWWGSIRGLGSGLARHAADYLDPGVDFTDEELKIARKMGAIDISSQANTPLASASGTPVRGSTPVPAGAKSGPSKSGIAAQPRGSKPAPDRKSSLSSSATTASASLPTSTFVSGAPGVDFKSLNPHWNTGSWSLGTNDHSRLQDNHPSPAAALENASRQPFRDPLGVDLVGRREETNPVISGFHSSHIQPYLPPRLKLGRTWRLLYSSDQDGVSLETLYRKVDVGLDPKKNKITSSSHHSTRFDSDRNDAWLRGSSAAARAALGSDLNNHGGSHDSSMSSRRLGSGLTSISDAGLILAIRDENDQVFGGYVNEGFKNTKGYYGNGDCFLWRTCQPKNSTPYIKTYSSTLLNNYFIQSTSSYLSLGGDINGKYGLWIDSSFEKGISAKCETFENEILCDDSDHRSKGNDGAASAKKEKRFEPVIVEIWAVGID
ncbi:unnamed protein product [Sympodiomycopsis kandeliae]